MITDIDKSNADRSAPNPNRHDQLSHLSVPAKGTNSTNYITPASNQSALLAGKNGQFTIVQVGNFTTTQTYNTSNPGAGLFINDNFTIYSAPHGLGFTPGFFAYEQQSTGQYTAMPYNRYAISSSSQALWYTFEFFVDNVNVYIALYTMTYGNFSASFVPGFIFKYYLLQQTSN